jgi:uncharacterized protein (DUF488 family)
VREKVEVDALVLREDRKQPVFTSGRAIPAEEVAGRSRSHAVAGLCHERAVGVEQEVAVVRNAVVRRNVANG